MLSNDNQDMVERFLRTFRETLNNKGMVIFTDFSYLYLYIDIYYRIRISNFIYLFIIEYRKLSTNNEVFQSEKY